MTKTLLIVLLILSASVPKQAHAVKITQRILQRGIYTFPQTDLGEAWDICQFEREQLCPATEDNAYLSAVCRAENQKRCVCAADVVYPQVEEGHSSRSINKIFRNIAERYKCAPGFESTDLDYEQTFQKDGLLSFVFTGSMRGTGTNSSCSGSVVALTVDADNDRVLNIKDILRPSDYNSAANYIVAYLSGQTAPYLHNEEKDIEHLRLKLRRLLDRRFWKLGFYLKGHSLILQIDDYLVDCASGPSYAVPIPRHFVASRRILKALQ
jgi:hypothetical protein